MLQYCECDAESIMSCDRPTIVSFAVPKPQDETDIKEQLETYRLLNKVSSPSSNLSFLL